MRHNEAIGNLISQDIHVQGYVYQELRKKWPQINDQTKVSRTGYTTLRFERHSSFFPMNMIQVAISGLRRLKTNLFPRWSEDVDDPDIRWTYTVRFWRALVKVPTYWLYRLLGRILRRQDLIRKGMEDVPAPHQYMVQDYDEIHMERFGWQFVLSPWIYGVELERGYMVCAYYAPHDTLYVYDVWTERR